MVTALAFLPQASQYPVATKLVVAGPGKEEVCSNMVPVEQRQWRDGVWAEQKYLATGNV